MALTPMAFTPSDGLKNTLSFPTNPSSEADARKQIQDVLDQLKTGINLLETELQAETAASLLGAIVGGVASNIQAFIDIVEAAGVGSLPPSGSVTNPMMATDVKIGSLAELTFGDKSSITYSLNLIYTAVEAMGYLLALNVTTGSSNTYVVTYNPAKTSYSQSYIYGLKANFSNTGSSTLEFNSLGAKTIKKVTAAGLVDLVANDIISGGFYLFTYNGTYIVLLNPSSSLERVLTTQGDMVYASSANTPARLAKGTAYQALGMNSGATAQQWMESLQSLMTAAGDIVVASGANTPARKAKGSALQVLQVNSGGTDLEYADKMTYADFEGDDQTTSINAGATLTKTISLGVSARFAVVSVATDGASYFRTFIVGIGTGNYKDLFGYRYSPSWYVSYSPLFYYDSSPTTSGISISDIYISGTDLIIKFENGAGSPETLQAFWKGGVIA